MQINCWKRVLSTFLLICLAGCFSAKPPKQPHTFRMNISREPSTLDPRKGGDMVSSSMHYLLYEGLVRLNPNGTITPAQARLVEISDDRLTYTFHLRKTRWSDGSFVTAQDFEYAWKKIISPQFHAVNAHLLYPIKNAEKVKKGQCPVDQIGITSKDEFTLVVVLEKPTPYFLELVSFCVFFPVKHQIDTAYPNWMQEASTQFVTNGPFKLKTWKHHQEIVLEKNKEYWEAPYIDLDQVIVSMIADENTALSMYENGQLDIIGTGNSPLPSDSLLRYSQQGALKIQAAAATTIVCFNVNKYPFNNQNIRKAFAYALNRSQIVQNITQLGEEIATRLIPPILNPGQTESLFEDHNIQKAQQYLKMGLQELGLTLQQFPKVTLDYSSSEMNRKLVQVLQEQWQKNLGIYVHLQSYGHHTFINLLATRSYDLAQTFWMAQYHDPMNILERFKFKENAKNYPGWENPDFIHLLDQSAYDETPEKRLATFAKAEALMMDAMPIIPIYHWKTAFLIKDHLKYPDCAATGAFDYARITTRDPQ